MIYISGKITGEDDYLEKFQKAEDRLIALGYKDIVNPARILSGLPSCTSYDQYMTLSFALLDMCDCVVFLPDWRESCGASQEYGYSLATDKIMLDYKGAFRSVETGIDEARVNAARQMGFLREVE